MDEFMEIEGIRYLNYNDRGVLFSKDYQKRKQQKNEKNRTLKPIDAVTYEIIDIDKGNSNTESDIAKLTQLVKSLPDDYVKERINQMRDSFPIIDDFLIEKLIMEAL